MLEQIYYREINLDNEGNFTMDITKDNAVDKKKFLPDEEYLISGILIKPVRNNGKTKWDDFAKIESLSEKINNAKRTKTNLFDLIITVSMEGTPKVSFEEN